MARKVIMPKQGLQMTEGTILRWLVKEGGQAVKNEPLFEMETDKLTITMEAPESGTLLKIVKGEGETVPITQTIAVIGEPGEDYSDLLETAEKKPEQEPQDKLQKAQSPRATADGKAPVFISPRAKSLAQDKGIDYSGIAGSGTDGMIVEKDILAHLSSVKATPLAKKVVADSDVELGNIEGSGANGKITKNDILSAIAGRKKDASRGETILPLAGMRKVIAERMTMSLRTAAQATHSVKADMTESALLREAYKRKEIRISYNDIVVYAVCRALKDFPMMNAEIIDEGIRVKDYVNMGVAVSMENGLIVPVIKDADLMSLEEISEASRALAAKAKDGTLGPDGYKGGSFTVTNLGMYGLTSFTAIINPPESGILAVGAIEKTPVVTKNDAIVVKPMMSMTLTYDHRVVDGAPAAEFLMKVKAYLETPYLML